MENNDRRPRHPSSTSGYAGQQGLLQSQTQYSAVSASDRYGRTPLSATSAPSSTSRAGTQGYSFAYGQGSQYGAAVPPVAASNMGYTASDYSTPDQQRGQYPYGQMYSVPSQQAASPTSPYDSVQQPYPRQNAAIEVLANQFSPVAPPYYGTSEGGPTSSSAAGLTSSQYTSLGYTTQQSPVGREPLATAYSAAGMTDPIQATSSGGYPQARYDAGSSNVPTMDASFEQYQTQLKQAFQHIRDGRLNEAGTLIYQCSDYLLNSVEQLGLVRDEENTHAERLKMWEEFNDCWLTALQRQKEMLRQLVDSGQRPQPPQSLIEYSYLEQMGDTLVKACDSMEKHGLVDYQMGVWEEEIIAMLTSCLDLWEQAGATPSAQRAGSATSRRR